MYEHSSKWIGGQDISASTLENAMLQLGSGASATAKAGHAAEYRGT